MSANRIVVTFDLCSSSRMLEDLTLTGNVEAFGKVLGHLQEFVSTTTKHLAGEVYQFTGDGWILLFPDEVDEKQFVSFLSTLCHFVHHLLRAKILPVLESTPERMGITIGIDRGPLLNLTLDKRTEWVGRAINVACRLQNAIKDNDNQPEYKVLMSKQVFQKLQSALMSHNPHHVKRELRNIGKGSKYECVKVRLLKLESTMKPSSEIQKNLQKRLRSPITSMTPEIRSAILRRLESKQRDA